MPQPCFTGMKVTNWLSRHLHRQHGIKSASTSDPTCPWWTKERW